jgi:hypothetical protein
MIRAMASDESGSLEIGASAKKRGGLRITAVLAVLAVIGVAVWLVVSGTNKNNNTGPIPLHKTVVAISLSNLESLANTLPRPIYWAGPERGITYELTRINNGKEYVRYLPAGVKVGTSASYPLVATLPLANAYAATAATAEKPGSVAVRTGRNTVAFYLTSRPKNIYVAYVGTNFQVQVFAPNPAKARAIVTSGELRPISLSAPGAATPSLLTAASVPTLSALPVRLGHAVYWAGSRKKATYELTETTRGAVFIRYLPPKVKVGSPKRYMFIGTLPVFNAFKATAKAAALDSAVKVPIPGGGVAFYNTSVPQTIYAAFPGSNYQIQVFDMNTAQGRALVKAGAVTPLP